MPIYTFCVQGHLDPAWVAIFDGLTIQHTYNLAGEPVTYLEGPVADQSRLYGVLSGLRSLGVALVSVQPNPDSGEEEAL